MMINRSLILIFAVVVMVACSGRTGSTLLNSREGEPTITPTPPKLENIQIVQLHGPLRTQREQGYREKTEGR